MPIYYRPSRGYLTPPVLVIGDEVAQGISYKLSESAAITRAGINSGYLETLIDRDVSVWPYIRNNPWIVIACGTNDGYADYYSRMRYFRAKLNRVAGGAGEANPHVIWVKPLNNAWARNNIDRMAASYHDLVLDMPTYTTQNRTVAVQVPVYYPWPWNLSYPGVVWRYDTSYRTVTENVWLSSDNVRPNEAGYTYMASALRRMTANWNVRYPY